MTTERFLSIITSATHPRWPPSWIFPSIRRQTPRSIHPIFLWKWKVPFDDQLRRSSNTATTAAILDLVSVDYLTNAWWLVRCFGASLGVINLHHAPLLPKPYLPYTHRQCPNRGHMPRLALPLFYVGLKFSTISTMYVQWPLSHQKPCTNMYVIAQTRAKTQ
jgi:hypothetical protein